MPYATLTDLVTRFGETELAQLTDRSHTGAAIDAEVVQRACRPATGCRWPACRGC